MKQFIFKFFASAFGTTLAGFAARIIIGILMFVTGGVSDLGAATRIVFDKEAAIAAAAVLIHETPKKEIKAALAAEEVSPVITQAIEVTK